MRRSRSQATAEQQQLALQCASLLLDYPDTELLGQVPLLQAAARSLPAAASDPLARICTHLLASPLAVLQEAYVDTFDLRRRCCLYLTYYAYGDTRKRGMALLRFSQAYSSSGAVFEGGELPDHLGVVCEFAATSDLELGLRLLAENRAGLELLRAALVDAESAYVDVIDVVRAVLPDPAPRDLQRAMDLARTGPPEEEVGLEPYGPPESMGART
jgi:nitrate reductase delta subunit